MAHIINEWPGAMVIVCNFSTMSRFISSPQLHSAVCTKPTQCHRFCMRTWTLGTLFSSSHSAPHLSVSDGWFLFSLSIYLWAAYVMTIAFFTQLKCPFKKILSCSSSCLTLFCSDFPSPRYYLKIIFNLSYSLHLLEHRL